MASMRPHLLSVTLLLAFSLPTAWLAAGETLLLRFGVYTSDKPTVMYGKFRPILSVLEKKVSQELGRRVKIKLRIFKSYDGANDALVEGKVDFVRFGPASYVLAKLREEGIALLAVEEIGGETPRRFNGVILTRDDNPVRRLEDLKGKSFAFGDEYSTIGRYLSQALLVENGIRAADLSRYEYLGRHDKVVTAVLHGKFDAGAAKEGTFRKYADRGLRIVRTFDNVTKPWVARAGLERSVQESLTRALLAVKDAKVLTKVGKQLVGFGKVEDREYEFVRAGMKTSESFEEAVATDAGGKAPVSTETPATVADPEGN